MALKKKKNKSVVVDEYEDAYGDSYSPDSNEDAYDSSDSYGGSSDSYGDPYDIDTENTKKRKKKSGGGGALTGLLAVLVVLVLIAGVFFGVTAIIGPTKGQCKDTIETTEYALNNSDVMTFCDVINPSIGRKIKAAIMLVDVTAEDAVQYLEGAIGQLGSALLPDDGTSVSDVLKGIEIEPYSYGLPGKTRNVKCNITYNGSTYAKVKLVMKKSEGEVYISKIMPVK